MHSSVLVLLFAVFGCTQAFNFRSFVQKMVVKDLDLDEVNNVNSFVDHALFQYMRENYAPKHLKGQKNQGGLLTSFSWDDCGSSLELLKIIGLSVTPDPVVLPGKINLKAAVNISQTVDAPLKMSLEVKKKLGFIGWIEVPCIDDLGSCTYDDMCEKLAGATCPPVFVKNNIPCKCPFTHGTYSIPTTTYTVDQNPIPSGDYKANIKLSYKDQQVLCMDLAATIN